MVYLQKDLNKIIGYFETMYSFDKSELKYSRSIIYLVAIYLNSLVI